MWLLAVALLSLISGLCSLALGLVYRTLEWGVSGMLLIALATVLLVQQRQTDRQLDAESRNE